MAYLALDPANIPYWANRPRQCRDLAQSGLRYIADGPTAAMLHLKHGRAAAQLGDLGTARRAIGEARDAGSIYRAVAGHDAVMVAFGPRSLKTNR